MNSRNKIMTLISSEFPPGPGGIGIHAWQIVRILNKSGMNVKVLCPLDHVNHTTAKRFDISQGFEIVRWPGSKFSIYNNLLRIFSLGKKNVVMGAFLCNWHRFKGCPY